MPDQFICVDKKCGKRVTATANKRYRSHYRPDGEKCELSSTEIPPRELEAGPLKDGADPGVPEEGRDFAICECKRRVKLTRLGYFEPHDKTLRGGDKCPKSGTRHRFPALKKTDDLELPPAPPVDETVAPVNAQPVKDRKSDAGYALDVKVRALPAAPTETSSQESATTSTPLPEWTERSDFFWVATPHAMLMDALGCEEGSAVADSAPPDQGFDDLLFAKAPSKYPPRSNKPMRKMSEREQEIAGRIKEIFYAYTNRDSSDNRSAQKTIGPSEAGTPCDRQLAMKLLNIEPVNPQESWAPFVGTAVHEELARMFEWANGSGSGRFVTEMSVSFGSIHVPRGTLDLLDRVLYMVDDHKLMGRWSLEQLRKEGPSETYRKQIQIYGLGAELAGEEVREVAIIAWPRQESSLNKLFVHVEPYDRQVARDAIARVERIAQEVETKSGPGTPRDPMAVARSFPIAEDCKWCPFHLERDKEMGRGCPGK